MILKKCKPAVPTNHHRFRLATQSEDERPLVVTTIEENSAAEHKLTLRLRPPRVHKQAKKPRALGSLVKCKQGAFKLPDFQQEIRDKQVEERLRREFNTAPNYSLVRKHCQSAIIAGVSASDQDSKVVGSIQASQKLKPLLAESSSLQELSKKLDAYFLDKRPTIPSTGYFERKFDLEKTFRLHLSQPIISRP